MFGLLAPYSGVTRSVMVLPIRNLVARGAPDCTLAGARRYMDKPDSRSALNWIDGDWAWGGAVRQSINPATYDVIGSCARGVINLFVESGPERSAHLVDSADVPNPDGPEIDPGVDGAHFRPNAIAGCLRSLRPGHSRRTS
jgi:hypothetical protein